MSDNINLLNISLDHLVDNEFARQKDINDESDSRKTEAFRLIDEMVPKMAEIVVKIASNLHVIDKNIHDINMNTNRLEAEKMKQNFEIRKNELKYKMSKITQTFAKFAIYMKNNCELQYKEPFKAMLLDFVDRNKTTDYQQIIETLKKTVFDYEENKYILDRQSNNFVSTKQIFDSIDALNKLNAFGEGTTESHTPVPAPRAYGPTAPTAPVERPVPQWDQQIYMNLTELRGSFNPVVNDQDNVKQLKSQSLEQLEVMEKNEKTFYCEPKNDNEWTNDLNYKTYDTKQYDNNYKSNNENKIQLLLKQNKYLEDKLRANSMPYLTGIGVDDGHPGTNSQFNRERQSHGDVHNISGEFAYLRIESPRSDNRNIYPNLNPMIANSGDNWQKKDYDQGYAEYLRQQGQAHGPYQQPFQNNNFINNKRIENETKSHQRIKLRNNEDINILLLGETGVGKSTFINAFANYLTFDSLKEAVDRDIVSLIPSSFTISDENFEQITVRFGEDNNECSEEGKSATQGCKSYAFPFGGGVVRLIDTPGVGDTRGIDQDRLNFANILDFISQYEDLHCICILLKPNNARITVTFEFCIKQLLTHLQKDASKNIVFLFTNARSTLYKPGDTAPAMRTILKSIEKSPPYVEIKFQKNNMYCLDNEAFRFLVALKNGIHFESDEMNNFVESWKISTKECYRLLEYIIGTNDGKPGLKAHRVRDTISVNEARQLIVSLSQPLADIAQNIEHNIKILNKHKEEIQAEGNNIDALKGCLYIPQLDLEIIELDHPKTVCANASCCESYNVGGVKKYNYKTICHNHCYLNGVEKDVLGDPGLMGCLAMKDGKCTVCENSCDYTIHLHVYYDTNVVENKIRDSNVEKQIKTKEGVKAQALKTIRDIELRSNEIQREMSVITTTTAKFAHFLKVNAITPYNDAFKAYLEHLIKNEESLSQDCPINKQSVQGLKQMLLNYEQEKAILDKAINTADDDECCDTSQEIFEEVKQLYKLKHYGQKIKDSQTKQKGSRLKQQQQQKRDVVHDHRNKQGHISGHSVNAKPRSTKTTGSDTEFEITRNSFDGHISVPIDTREESSHSPQPDYSSEEEHDVQHNRTDTDSSTDDNEWIKVDWDTGVTVGAVNANETKNDSKYRLKKPLSKGVAKNTISAEESEPMMRSLTNLLLPPLVSAEELKDYMENMKLNAIPRAKPISTVRTVTKVEKKNKSDSDSNDMKNITTKSSACETTATQLSNRDTNNTTVRQNKSKLINRSTSEEEFDRNDTLDISLLETMLTNSKKYKQYFSAVNKILSLIETKLRNNVCDIEFQLAWGVMTGLTDEMPVNCERFVENKGMNSFIVSVNAFPNERELLSNILIVLSNIVECSQLRHKLMEKKFIQWFILILDQMSGDVDVWRIVVTIAANIVSAGADFWQKYLSIGEREDMLSAMRTAMKKWKINADFNIRYSSFEPFIRLLKSNTIECQYWAVWTLANACRVNCSLYCPLLVKDNCIEVLKTLMNDESIDATVRQLSSLTVFQNNMFLFEGNLDQLINSDSTVLTGDMIDKQDHLIAQLNKIQSLWHQAQSSADLPKHLLTIKELFVFLDGNNHPFLQSFCLEVIRDVLIGRNTNIVFKTTVGLLGAVKKVLHLIEKRIHNKVYDKVFILSWLILVALTDETPINCRTFVNNNGLNCFISSMNTFPQERESIESILIAINNVSECPDLRHLLMKQEYIDCFMWQMECECQVDSHIRKAIYSTVGILAHIVSEGKDYWKKHLPLEHREKIVHKMRYAINKWKINSDLCVNYSSFDPIVRLLKSKAPESQHFAAWTLANCTRVQSKRRSGAYDIIIIDFIGSTYCPLLAVGITLSTLGALVNDRKVDTTVKRLVSLTLYQYDMYGKYGHVNGLDASEDIDIPCDYTPTICANISTEPKKDEKRNKYFNFKNIFK